MPDEFIERRSGDAVEVRLARLEERTLSAAEALRIAANNLDRRLEQMNELRDQINKERGSYYTRKEAESLQHFQYMVMGGLIVLEFIIGSFIYFFHPPR